MATKLSSLNLELAHFNNFAKHIPNQKSFCKKTINQLLNMGILQVSTAFEHALAHVGGHQVVSEDEGDLLRNGKYSDAKLASVRTSSLGAVYSAPIRKISNKIGALRVQVYERKQNKFYYFVIPHYAYKDISKKSNIEIPFEMDGTPKRINKTITNWWNFETDSWEEMAVK